MPAPGAGFGYAVFGEALFGDEPESAEFITKIESEFNEPILRLFLNNRTYDNFIIDAPTISRGADIIAGAINVVVSNTPKAQIHGVGIAFVDATPATITDAGSGFLTAGFATQDKIAVSGSTSNDGDYIIDSVVAGTITLVAGDTLTNEGTSALVSILAQPAFNFFVENRIDNMGRPANMSLVFSGTTGGLKLMSGTVEDVSYNGATVTLSIRDAMAPTLEKRIGSGQISADYYTTLNPFNPATIVWLILTKWGELDDTFTTSNKDINFTSWQDWYDRCAARNYECRARFPGTTIHNALLRIADLTNSFIWVDAEGMFRFTMFEPPYAFSGSDRAYDTDNAVSIDVDIDKSTVKNAIVIYYGHDPDANYNPAATISSNKIGFGDDNPDRIYLVEHYTNLGFLASGFNNSDPITVSGSEQNDGRYGIETVANGVMTLYAENGLTEEPDGASVTLTQSKDTSVIQTTTLVFNVIGGNHTITSAAGIFIIGGFSGTDSVTIVGSEFNDGTHPVLSIEANTITLDGAVLAAEASGNNVTISQTHTVTLTATTIGFEADEEDEPFGWGNRDSGPVDHIFKADVNQVPGATTFIDAGFEPAYQVTVSGSNSNDGTYRLSQVDEDKLTLLHQTLADEAAGPLVTITQSHTTRTTGKQFEAFTSVSDAESIALYGVRLLTDEDKVVWHDNLTSANAAAVAKLFIYKFPQELVRISATMAGFLTDPGDTVNTTEAYRSMNAKTYFVKGIDLDVEQGIANIIAERGTEGG